MTKISNLTKFVVLTTSLASRQFISQRSYYSLWGSHSLEEVAKKLDELKKSIVFPNKNYDITGLKNEIARLKIRRDEKLDELKSIVFPNKSCEFTGLKNEIIRLKIKELIPQLQNQKEQIEKLITDSERKLSEESKTILDFYLTALKQGDNSFRFEKNSLKEGRLDAYEEILKTKLTSENVKQIRQLQEKINQDQKHLDNLQGMEMQGKVQ